jgi:hypothetical protein
VIPVDEQRCWRHPDIYGAKGVEREPHLLQALLAIRAQSGELVECASGLGPGLPHHSLTQSAL